MDNGVVLKVDRDGPEVVVRLRGEIDLSSSDEVRNCLLAFAGDIVTVDCSRVTFMDVTALTAFVIAQQRTREDGGKLVLYGVQPMQRRLLEGAQLDHFFDCIVPD